MNNIKAILEQINNIVLVVSPTSEVQYVSPSVKSILGYNPAELTGSQWWAKTCEPNSLESTKTDVLQHLTSSIKLGGIQTERKVLTSYGSEKWFLWNTSMTKDGNIISVGTDISDKKKNELALANKNIELSEKNQEISDSLDYAKRLQEVILPEIESYKNAVADAFVLYLPKDKVSGDFHWFYESEDFVFVAAVDCTGHGVPGALLSVVGNSLLRDIIIKTKQYEPKDVLSSLDKGLIEAMSKNEVLQARDGMDIALVRIDKRSNQVVFAGAYRPMIYITDNRIEEIGGSRFPIGFHTDVSKTFDQNEITLSKGDRIYLFSDGATDQFGGQLNKKFKKAQLKDILISAQDLDMYEQREFIEYTLKNWQQNNPQTDDILVIGLEI